MKQYWGESCTHWLTWYIVAFVCFHGYPFSLRNFGILCKGYYLKTEFNVSSKSMFEPESLTFFSRLNDQHERLFCAIKKLSSRHLRLFLLIIHVSSNFKWLVSCEIYETLTNAKHNVPNHEIFPKQNDDMDSKRATVQHRDKVGKKKNTVEIPQHKQCYRQWAPDRFH